MPSRWLLSPLLVRPAMGRYRRQQLDLPLSEVGTWIGVASPTEGITVTEDRDEAAILEGKLYPASGTRRPMPRPRLDSLSDVLDGSYPVGLVVAPAGYGKSTLSARWHTQLVDRGVPCAWLSLDENDDDKVRFLRHLFAALRKADVHTGQAVAANLSADSPGGTT